MRGVLTMVVIVACLYGANAQPKPAYELFDSNGKKVSHKKMMKALLAADIVLFGELHNNPIAHWLQLSVAKDAHLKRDLVLGAEMVEADNQAVLNSYLKGEIDAEALDTLARMWNNYATDYAPLVDFSKANNRAFIATNVPRKYASLVYKKGFEALDTLASNERQWIAPLPIAYNAELLGYKNMVAMMGGHGGPNMPKAQALKDVTMAHFILKNYTSGQLFLHFNGAYHSDNYEGILWYLKQAQPNLNYITISTVAQGNVAYLLEENKGKADYIICVDETLPGSY